MNKKLVKTICALILMISTILLFGCTSNVEDKPYTLEFNSKSYDGLFTGVMTDGIPNEEGKFVCGEEGTQNYLIYEGGWENGAPKGKGTLSTDNYIVHFPKTDVNDAFDRTGEYIGETIDGIANGQGKFKAVNGNNQEYTYDGEWKDGLWNGYGVRSYTNNDSFSEIGKFINGDYDPELADLVVSLGTNQKNCPYSLSDEAYNFIKEHEEIFVKHSKKKIDKLSPKEFSIGTFKKNASEYKPRLVEVSWLYILQAFEENFGGYDLTYELATDQDGNIYSLYYIGKSDNIAEGNEVRTIFMPLGYSTYTAVNGNTPWAVSGLIAY